MKRELIGIAALAGAATASAQTLPPVASAPAPSTASPAPKLSGAPVVPIVSALPSARERRRPATAAEVRVRAANQEATRNPSARGFINAVQVYPFNDGVLYRLLAAPERVTDIALQPGEAITSVAAGDTVRWTVGDTTSGAGASKRVHILVKPFSTGISTNLIITTDRRTYRLQLDSTSVTAMAAISWTYPLDDLLAIRRSQEDAGAAAPVASGLDIERLNFGYTITGDDPAWRPLRAFDDGRQTFIEFSPRIAVGEAPPLFVIGDQGNVQLVNYRMAGRFYVVDRLFGVAELRLGGKKQAIVRIARVGQSMRRRAS